MDGHKTLRLPPGDYSVTAYLDDQGEQADRSGLDVLVDPETVLDHSADVVLDARNAHLLQTTAPQSTEDRQRKVDLSIVDDTTGMEFRSAYAVSAVVRRHLRVADPADDARVVHADDPLAQG